MELYVGGFAQGKLAYVQEKYGKECKTVEDISQLQDVGRSERVIFDSFHRWFWRELERGESPEDKMDAVLLSFPNLLVISSEPGDGLMPMEAKERDYRERLGRYLCRMARMADRVERIVCGIGQRIK